MTPEAIRETVRRVLHSIAPEAELDSLAPAADLRIELDLDSMDFLRFITGLHAELGVEVPEADYRKLGSLDGCVSYLSAHAPAAPRP
jgi:acyl carrier protein